MFPCRRRRKWPGQILMAKRSDKGYNVTPAICTLYVAGFLALHTQAPCSGQQNLVRTTGVGVHPDARAGRSLCVRAQPNTGIVFHRVTCLGSRGPARPWRGAIAAHGCSVLQQGNVRVSTVEHLMSALVGLRTTRISTPLSVPTMDGSAATFVYLLRSWASSSRTRPSSSSFA